MSNFREVELIAVTLAN